MKQCSILGCAKPAHCRCLCIKHYSSLKAYGDPLAAKTAQPRSPLIPGSESTRAIWNGMKNRCLNPRNKDFGRYGGRGIGVCERWMTFANFLADMGPRPAGLTIERIKNDRGYEPGNCQWATRREQRRNTATTRIVVLDGEAIPLVEACEKLGLKHRNVRQRLLRGKSVSQALETERATARG